MDQNAWVTRWAPLCDILLLTVLIDAHLDAKDVALQHRYVLEGSTTGAPVRQEHRAAAQHVDSMALLAFEIQTLNTCNALSESHNMHRSYIQGVMVDHSNHVDIPKKSNTPWNPATAA